MYLKSTQQKNFGCFFTTINCTLEGPNLEQAKSCEINIKIIFCFLNIIYIKLQINDLSTVHVFQTLNCVKFKMPICNATNRKYNMTLYSYVDSLK